MSLNTQILIAAILGVVFGFILNLFPDSTFFSASLYGIGLMSSIFIGLLKMLLIPLIFSSIVVGCVELTGCRAIESSLENYVGVLCHHHDFGFNFRFGVCAFICSG